MWPRKETGEENRGTSPLDQEKNSRVCPGKVRHQAENSLHLHLFASLRDAI